MGRVAAEVGSTANRYEILAKLARGGMADIFLARGRSAAGVERYCVLKRILRERAGDMQFVEMFLDEARLAAQLQHPNIASVYDTGKLGDSYFFTMEYVHGETVRSLVQRSAEVGRPLPLACALTIVAGTAAGLHHAHERNDIDGRALGIVHRDVSPSNLMISYEGNVKVVDFGVAKAAHRVIETRSGTVKGKIGYLSPEQCAGKGVDRRSDLFSLGIVMWEMLTGERLYRRDSDFANMAAIVYEKPVAPSAYRPDVSREVDELVLRLLAKLPADRFQTAAEAIERIEAVAMQAGLMVSTLALGRLVRELFGQRPEPWLELDITIASGGPVSIATDATQSGSALSTGDMIEANLAEIVQLDAASRRVETPAVESITQRDPARSPSTTTVVATSSARPRRWNPRLLAALIAAVAAASVVAVWAAVRHDAGISRPDAIEPAAVPPWPPPPLPADAPVAHDTKVQEERASDAGEIEIIDAGPARVPPATPPESLSRLVEPRPVVRPHAMPPRPAPTPEEQAGFASCGTERMTKRRAPECTRFACRVGAAKAELWVAYVPRELRSDLVALCKASGIDLTKVRLDCADDAAACP
ncbi:MAG TPA: serine/threonine-protein kinase [Kofleriaceae bacterium]